MGRHSSTPVQEEPVHEKRRQTLTDMARRVWQHVVPEEFRRRMYHRRRRWWAWLDRRFMPKGEWDARLPKDPSMWIDDWQWGSDPVAVNLRTTRRRRGDLLPDHSKEQS